METKNNPKKSGNDNCRRKETSLSASDLFQWRKRENLPVPQRGGVKDFDPDGSWLQDKRLEAFYEEHLTVLSEPRVEKSGNLVKGTWDSEKRLVKIEKTAKFWMKMGFADNNSNWLYPEEALFLMEVNCLDVLRHGVSLSLQEAHGLLLHSTCGVSEEEYQVYAHLRRLGFIVLRHAGKLDITPYEMKIGLHKHSKKKKKKRSKKNETDQSENQSTKPQSTSQTHHQNECVDGVALERTSEHECDEDSMHEPERGGIPSSTFIDSDRSYQGPVPMVCSELDTSQRQSECTRVSETVDSPKVSQPGHKRTSNFVDGVSSGIGGEEPPEKKTKFNDGISTSSNECSLNDWSNATVQSLSRPSRLPLTKWDFSVLQFPDMGGKDTVSLPIPPAHCLPPNTCVDEEYEDVCLFDAEEYRQQQGQWSALNEEDNYGHLTQLEFSYADWYKTHCTPVAAQNWREWKHELEQREKSAVLESPVAHLWQGDVTPLVQPQDSHSTASLLDKLSVIQSHKGPFSSIERQGEVKISYDVYLPNTNFKKSSPGLPDHRVCVARGEQPPELFDVHAASSHLDDGVPIHWAVVNCGDISFFVFDDLDLPVHPSSLG